MNARLGLLAFASGFGAFSVGAAEPGAWSDWAAVTVDRGWYRPPIVRTEASEGKLAVDPGKGDQVMLGFGTAVSELSWQALSILSEADRAAVLDEIFRPEGAAFTVIRTPIGSSDFAFGYYSYDDEPGDFAMKRFSLEIDERALLPLLREIKARVPADDFRLWASPWCPPKWLKRNGLYAQRPGTCADYGNDVASWDDAVYIGEDAFTCDPRHYAAYAKYFRRYVDAMAEKGFPLWMVMPQNESNSAQPYPACTWRAETLADFTVNYLAPALEGSGVKVFAGTIEEGSTVRVHAMMRLPGGPKAIAGAGFQWAGRGVIGCIHARYPDLFLMQTEHECCAGANDWNDLVHSWKVMQGFIGQGASAYDYWNLALTDEATSTWGWKQNSLVTVDRATKTARFNPEYYLMKALSHYVKKGARRLVTSGAFGELAFANADGSTVVLFLNERDDARALDVEISGRTYRAALPPRALAVFVADGKDAEAAAPATVLKVDCTKASGPVKPVNGVGQPPNLGWINGRLFWHLTAAGVPFSRLHDVGGEYGGNRFVDIPNLFRDFDADENDPANYDFGYTDRLVTALVENRIEPFFRLGVSIENEAGAMGPFRIRPPKDYAKWARICEHVIRHYTQGWANGFNYRITRWEIWNEPENSPDPRTNPMWSGTFADYLDFYGVVAPYLKSKFPALEFGGYGSSGFYAVTGGGVIAANVDGRRLEYFVTAFREFLARARKEQWPLDFFSLHSYDLPHRAREQIAFCRKTLDEYGFTTTKIAFDEWLPEPDFAKLGTDRQAAEIAAELVMLEESAADDAALYDAACQPSAYAPLFDPATREPRLALDSFKAFNELRKLGTRVPVAGADVPGLYATAATDGQGRGALMIANISGRDLDLDFDFGGAWISRVRQVGAGHRFDDVAYAGTVRDDTVLLVEFLIR